MLCSESWTGTHSYMQASLLRFRTDVWLVLSELIQLSFQSI